MRDDERLAAIRARADAATNGPWEIYRYRHGAGRIFVSGDDGRKRTLIADTYHGDGEVATIYDTGDREFLFAAREDVPWLVDQLEAAQRREQAVRVLHLQHGRYCTHCAVVYPCPTVRALDGEATA